MSGSPIIDGDKRFVGMVMQKHNVDTTLVLPSPIIEKILLEKATVEMSGCGTSDIAKPSAETNGDASSCMNKAILDPDEVNQIVKWIRDADYRKLAHGDHISNLEFIEFVKKLRSDSSLLGLDATSAICPLHAVAKERGLETILGPLEILARQKLARIEDPAKSTRAHLREIGQEFTQIANQATADGNIDGAWKAANVAEVAFSQSIALFMQEEESSPFVSALASAMSDVPQTDIATYASVLSAVEKPVSWDFQAQPQKNRVFSSMLREYADANTFIARYVGSDVSERANLAAAAAYWSAVLSNQDTNRARSLRALGDAYVLSQQPDAASVAYATASKLAANAGEEQLSASTLTRMIESAEIAGIVVPHNDAAEIAIGWPASKHTLSEDSLSPDLHSAIQAWKGKALLYAH